MTRLKEFISRNSGHLSALALLLGFIVDNLTLRRVDLLPETLILYFYLAVAGISILLLHMAEEGKLGERLLSYARSWLPLSLQFAFGSLFSGFLVFYSRSGTLAGSWPFLLLLVFVFLGTEVFKKYTGRLIFQTSIFFFALFSFLIFSVPIAVGDMGSLIFLLSGLSAVVAFKLFLILLALTGPIRFKAGKRGIIASAVGIFGVINLLYFTNILPPIPLSLQEIEVYHSVARVGDSYVVETEKSPWYEFLSSPTIHMLKGQQVYVFSAVFAPTKISTEIVHRWEYWSETENTWLSVNTVEFPVSGGRDGGYRGYSFKSNVSPGKWRVSVETAQGQLIGRRGFTVEHVTVLPPLTTSSKQ